MDKVIVLIGDMDIMPQVGAGIIESRLAECAIYLPPDVAMLTGDTAIRFLKSIREVLERVEEQSHD